MIPQILVQFPYDSYYTMLLTDNTGFGAGKYDARTESKRSDGSMAGSRLRVVLLLLTHVGGVAPMQQIQAGPSNCLDTAYFNITQQLFKFNVSGTTAECDRNFRFTWDGSANQGPYNASIIPLWGLHAVRDTPAGWNAVLRLAS